jgi:hypothetical protein
MPYRGERALTEALDSLARRTSARLRLVRFEAWRPTGERSYLVKGILPRRGLVVLWGPPKCGKSFLMSTLALHVALGWDFRGRRVVQGPVVYCAAEGAEGFRARFEAFRRRFLAEGPATLPFYIVPAALDLIGEVDSLRRAIEDELGGTAPVLICLDTLNRTLAGSEARDLHMAAYIGAAGALQEAFGCAVAVVHHCGIEGTRPRGHSSLTGAADAQIAVKRHAAGRVVATVEWVKDSAEGETFVSALETVEIGIDADGDPITSCVLVPAEGEADRPKATLSPPQRIALKALQDAIAEAGELPPACDHIPPGAHAVRFDLWRRYVYQSGITASEVTEAKRKAFARAAEALVAKQLVTRWAEWTWLA